ncbi:hypothetical protein ALC57_14263 [Trachymyrmex cornetzi]|uniref:Uncharacterized protein n=1 Tax=Trachymyrmex cornetzi TaxID=471704 RepID=A0A195DL33_9HYME|nr:hypothetical protein ALC57_14263 [Trachymyrmex cornetzi]
MVNKRNHVTRSLSASAAAAAATTTPLSPLKWLAASRAYALTSTHTGRCSSRIRRGDAVDRDNDEDSRDVHVIISRT